VSKKVPVYFITPKPSIARWHLKDLYIAYNQQLKEWASRQKKVTYVDVWTPLLDSTGQPQKDIFIEDGLHLNKKGYEIWSAAIKPYVQ
jgi:lysophospholipase L1-like esterase